MQPDMKNGDSIGILRVSSTKQRLVGDAPDAQREAIERKATESSLPQPKKYFTFIQSASGEIQPSQEAIDYCTNPKNNIRYAFIARINRFTRAGAKKYIILKDQLEKSNVQLIDTLGVIDPKTVNTLEHLGVEYWWSKYRPSEKSEILEAEAGKDDHRQILSQLIGAEIRYVRMGYVVGVPQFGYKNKKIFTEDGERTVLEPEPTEAEFIIRIFELSAQNVSDKEIVEIVNAMGFKTRKKRKFDPLDKRKVIGYTGGEPLTVELMKAYRRNPIYAGIIQHTWLQGKSIKARFDGLVSIDQFNAANKGKVTIIDRGAAPGEPLTVIQGKAAAFLVKKDKFNRKFPYKFLHCDICHKPFYGSTSKGRYKYYSAYHCARIINIYGFLLKNFIQQFGIL